MTASINKKVIAIGTVLLILIAIPLTIYLVSLNKPQDLRSRASSASNTALLTKQLLSNVGDDAAQISAATQRKEKMKTLGKEDPDAFLLEVISEDIKRGLPIPAQEVIEQKVEIEGVLLENVVEEDSPEVNNERSSRSLIFQEVDSEGNTKNTYEVYLREEQFPDISGRAKIKGYLIDNILIPISIEKSDTVLGIATSGSLQIAVIMVNFKGDLSDTRNEFTPQILEKLYFSDPGSVGNYIKNTSLGNLTFQGDINDVYGWLTLKNYTRKQVCDIYEKKTANKGFIKAINQMAKVQATSRGKVFADYDIIAYVFPAVKEESKNDDGTNCYWNAITKGIPGDSVVDPIHFLNGDYDGVNDVNHGALDGASSIKFYSGILAHEVGHSLGLSHAHGLLCGDKSIASYQNCTLYNYGDRFDLIGGGWDYHSHTNAKNKLMQGWIPPGNMQTITSSGEYTLYSSSKKRTGQTQLIKIARPTDGGNFYLEYKSKNNRDDGAPSYIYSGAFLRLSDEDLPEIKNERGVYQDEWRLKQTYLIDVDKSDTSGRGGLLNPTFKDNLMFEDSRNKITIKQLSHDAESVKLSVTLGPPPCEKNNPSLSITEPVLSGKAGEKINYELSVTSNDSASCPKATFDLSAQAPSGWLVEFPTNGFSLAPTEAKKINVYITSTASSGINGNPYKTQITVKNRAAANFTKTKEARYNIEQSSAPTPTKIPPTSPPTAHNPQGNFDGSSCSTSTGWACDANNFSLALDIHFYADGPAGTGTLIGSVTANGAREAAVGNRCGGNSTHGFSFNTPQNLKDGRAHPIYAYAINIGPSGPNPLLGGSPKSITCIGPATPTATPTKKPTNTPSPSPTPQPTGTPTPTPQPNNTILHFASVKLHGIGTGGDNTNPNIGGNQNPLTRSRNLIVELYNTSGALAYSATGNIIYNTSSGDFSGDVKLGNTVTAGNYLIKVTSDKYLKRQLVGVIGIIKNRINQAPSVTLVVGDSNGDEKLSVLDYNLILDCYSDIRPAKNCQDPAKKSKADLSDDGKVNQDDYNLFLRELSVKQGD